MLETTLPDHVGGKSEFPCNRPEEIKPFHLLKMLAVGKLVATSKQEATEV